MKNFLFLIIIPLYLSCSTSHHKTNQNKVKEAISAIDGIEEIYTFGPTELEKTQFVDKAKDYGLDGLKAYNFYVVDLDLDGHSDLVYLENFYDSPKFLRFNPENRKFEPFLRDFFTQEIKASYLLFYDFNGDGIVDVLVGVFNQKTELEKIPLMLFNGKIEDGKLTFYKNEEAIKIPPGPHASVVPVDYNLDGELDLFVSNWYESKDGKMMAMPDILLENHKGIFTEKKFSLEDEYIQDKDKTLFLNATPTISASVCDIDQNGYPDILTSSTNGAPNKLWMNLYRLRKGERYFKDYGKESQYASDNEGNLNPYGGGRTFINLCADYNDDGIMDIFSGELSHSYDPVTSDKSSILTGSRFKFPPFFYRTEYFKESDSSLWHQSDRRALWQDFNNDGTLDLLIDNSGYPPHTRLVLFKQDENKDFNDVAEEVGINIINPISSVVLDINKDGKLDILTAQTNIRNAKIKERIYLFENQGDIPRGQRIYLYGIKSNRMGLGATLIFRINKTGKILFRKRTVEYSYGNLPPQNEEGIHIALPEDEVIESITVRWPYADKANQEASSMEKKYIYTKDYKKEPYITLCENGKILRSKNKGCEK